MLDTVPGIIGPWETSEGSWTKTVVRTTPIEINAPNVKDFANLDRVLWHLITLQSFSLTPARVVVFNQLVGIFVNSGPEETGIKDLFGGEICTMIPPWVPFNGIASDVERFLARHNNRRIIDPHISKTRRVTQN
ncbi:hypothetical protein Tco_1173318 [Tanacetum coccineum]